MSCLYVFACTILFVHADNTVWPTKGTVKCCNNDNVSDEIKLLVAEMQKQQLSLQALQTLVQKQQQSLQALENIGQSQQLSFQALETIGQNQQLAIQALKSDTSQRIETLDAKITSLANTSQETCQKIDSYLRNESDYVCPTGYVKNGNSCYTFNPNQVNWKTAAAQCLGDGSHLITVDSEEEQEFLEKTIKSINNQCPSNNRWWLGGNDLLREGNWVWEATGEKIGAGGRYTKWFPGEPDNDKDDDKDGEQCLQLRQHYVWWRWNDESCDIECGFICELQKV